MSWVAVVDADGDEYGCVWAQDISAITIEDDWNVVAWVKNAMFAVGVFPNQQQAEEAMQALALHVGEEREGHTIGDVNVGHSMTGNGDPDLLPLGPKSMAVLAKVAEAGGTVGLDYLAAAPAAVVAKLMPRFLKEDPEGTVALTTEARSLLGRYMTAVVQP